MPDSVPIVTRSAKQQLVLTAERLYALHGLDGVPLRQIGTEAGMANKSAVAYHFGSKERLVEAVLVNRLDELRRRRTLLQARTPPADLRRTVEAHQLPMMELAEDDNCYYLEFVEQLVRNARHPLDGLPSIHREFEQTYYDRVGTMITHVPQPLRDIRIHQASAFCLQVSADRHRARMLGATVTPFAVHVCQLLDGLVALLSAPPSAETLAALGSSSAQRPSLRGLP